MRLFHHIEERCFHLRQFWFSTEQSKTSTGLYRSCAALACFSGNFDLILFEAVNFEFIVEKVWFGEVCFGLVWIDGLEQP